MSTDNIKSRVEAIAAQYNIPKEKFEPVKREGKIHDERLQTKAIGYVGDAWIRFRKDKSAVVAFCLILVLALFAIVVPIFSSYTVTFRDRDTMNQVRVPIENLRNMSFDELKQKK